MKFQGLYSLIFFGGFSLADFAKPKLTSFPDWTKTERFTPDDLIQLKSLTNPIISPDKSRLVYSQSTYNKTLDQSGRNLRLVDIKKGFESVTDLTPFSFNQSDSSQTWINNDLVAFTAIRKSPAQNLFTVSTADGSVRQVTNYTNSINRVIYNPIANKIAFISSVYKGMNIDESTKESERLSQTPYSGVVYDKLFIRHYNTWITNKRIQLFTVDTNIVGGVLTVSGTPINIVEKYAGEWGLEPTSYSFSPDGKNILFVAKIEGREESWQTKAGIFTVPADGSTVPVMLNSDFDGAASSPVYSPNGKYIAWLQMATRGYESDQNQIILYDIATQKIKRLVSNWNRSPSSVKFSQDSLKLFMTVPYEVDEALFSLYIDDESLIRITKNGTVHTYEELTPNKLIVTMSTFVYPPKVFMIDADSNQIPTQITSENDKNLSNLWLSDIDTFWFDGALDEKVQGMVLYPYGFDPSKKYPIAFIVHGGPQNSWRNQWSIVWNPNTFTNQGYVVVIINFHGGDAYGQKFTDSIKRNWGTYPYEDLMKGLDYFLGNTTYTDSDNVVALGASYGGYMMNWINGHTNRFKALVNHDGVFSLVSMGYGTEELWFNEHDIGIPWVSTDRASMEAHNPERYVANWKTPTLVIHSDNDYRVPLTEGISTFTALQRHGIPSRFLYFPDESHVISKPANLLKWYSEVLKWIGFYTNTTVWQM
ncbi:hypothetical protein BB559_003846 [Furculomyces boomerangus]|uniref:Dipeptidyl-peptidase V n=1 Tax=Furculomyces boomerangus TaxID=61424 RepID=A0A2T9YID3_9FUNG|nr:hypothetical protein BB559_003846 [Furculomyces boomerangus]